MTTARPKLSLRCAWLRLAAPGCAWLRLLLGRGDESRDLIDLGGKTQHS